MPINTDTFSWLVIQMSLKGVRQILKCDDRSSRFVYSHYPEDLSALRVGGKAEAPDAAPGPVWIWCHRDGTQSQELPKEVFSLARRRFT